MLQHIIPGTTGFIYLFVYVCNIDYSFFGQEKLAATSMEDFLQQCGGYAVIDGGLATELESHGADLNDPLWSAKCLLSSPHLIRRVTYTMLLFI